MSRALLTIVLLLVCRITFACEEFSDVRSTLEKGVRSLLIQEVDALDTSDISFSTVRPKCKSWSQGKDLFVLVVPYLYGTIDYQRYFGFVVAIVEEEKKSIIGKFNETKLMVVDAVMPDGVKIDAANYRIGKSTLAFGIRVALRNSSSAAEFNQEFMNLYVMRGTEIKKILSGMEMEFSNVEGDGQCNFHGSDHNTVITLAKSETNGYLDLIANRKIKYFRSSEAGTNCKTIKGKIQSERYVLKFDGLTYRIPTPLQATLD